MEIFVFILLFIFAVTFCTMLHIFQYFHHKNSIQNPCSLLSTDNNTMSYKSKCYIKVDYQKKILTLNCEVKMKN
jgi:hypothetical protein